MKYTLEIYWKSGRVEVFKGLALIPEDLHFEGILKVRVDNKKHNLNLRYAEKVVFEEEES